MIRKLCKRFGAVLVAIFVFMASSFLPTHAAVNGEIFDESYFFNGKKLHSTISYRFFSAFGSATVSGASSSATTWNNAMGKSYLSVSSSRYDGAVQAPWFSDGVSCVSDFKYGQNGQVAVNYYLYDSSNYITQSDININKSYSWANSAQAGKYDSWTVLLHEFGHTVGLADIPVNTAGYSGYVMYEQMRTNFTRRSLSAGDIANVKKLYS